MLSTIEDQWEAAASACRKGDPIATTVVNDMDSTGAGSRWNARSLMYDPAERERLSADIRETGLRDVDERAAVYLLSLARELLRHHHGAIAGMIDYAIVEIEIEGGTENSSSTRL